MNDRLRATREERRRRRDWLLQLKRKKKKRTLICLEVVSSEMMTMTGKLDLSLLSLIHI